MTKCPKCGYTEDMNVKLVTNVMNNYIDPATGKVDGCFCSEEFELKVGTKTLVRADKYVPKPTAPAKPVTPAATPAKA